MPLRVLLGILIAVAAVMAIAPPAHAADHACAAHAVEQARKLLRFHAGDTGQAIGDATKARQLAPIRALKGNGQLDVLEVTSAIYKASYRMRFIYARIPGSCTLMGQEIVEASNPY
jgi:hypothetical protein